MTNLSKFQRELDHLPFILELPQGLRKRVSELFVHVSSGKVYTKGKTLYTRGKQDKSTGALLIKGSVEIDRGEGAPITRHAPELFGEMMLLDEHDRRTATLTIAEDSLVFQFKWNDLMAKARERLTVDQILDLKYALVKYAGSRFEELEELSEPEGGNADSKVEPDPGI